MRRGLNSQAYTIVEVIIFLAVSSALLVSALLFVGGQQRKTEFYQSIHDIEQQINDVMNNVSTGYYAKTTNFKCFINVSGDLEFDITDQSQGTNQGCIFIGRVIHFSVGGEGEKFNNYNIIGLRQTTDGKEVSSFDQAKPTVLPNNIENKTLKYGLNTKKMYYNGNPANTIGALGFISSLSSYNPTDTTKLISGSQTASIYGINNTNLSLNSLDTISAINTVTNILDPTNSVTICFASGGTDQYGVITIGGDNRQLSTKLDIMSTTEATTGGGPCI